MSCGELVADVKDKLLHLEDSQEELIVCEPMSEVGYRLLVGCD